MADEKVREIIGKVPCASCGSVLDLLSGGYVQPRDYLLARVEAERDAEKARAERWRAVADSLHSACGILVIGKPLRDLDERFCFYDKAAESDATERKT